MEPSKSAVPNDPLKSIPLVVDLDGTLIQTDLLLEALLIAARKKPWSILLFFMAWMRGGKIAAKNFLAKEIQIDPGTLPYRESVIRLLEEEQNAKKILVSASPDSWVKSVAEHIGFFQDSWGSTNENLAGNAKLLSLQEHGISDFRYVGDAPVDLALWEKSSEAIFAKPLPQTEQKLKSKHTPVRVLKNDDARSTLSSLRKCLRLHQWSKNLLIFVPMLAAHEFENKESWIPAIKAFFAFSFAASTVYVFNDLIDLAADRLHPTKRRRPLASGALSIPKGIGLLGALLLITFLASLNLTSAFAGVVLFYFIMNIAYSAVIKRLIILDVVVLGGFYTLRLLAGGYATDTPISQWLLAFSTFFFFGLALVKRYTEVLKIPDSKNTGRSYRRQDSQVLFTLGACCSVISILILSLYLNSERVADLYSHPDRLWLTLPVLLTWVGRVWITTHRGEMHLDPVVFAIRDRASWALGLTLGLVLWVAL